MSGIMTVGTLHRGAKLADHVHDGTISAWGTGIAASAIIPWRYYAPFPATRSDWVATFLGYTSLGTVEAIGLGLPIFVAGVGATGNPVLEDMKPGSAFLTNGGTSYGYVGLNSAPNLERERSLRRVSIEGQTSEREYGIFWQGVRPDRARRLAALTYTTADLLAFVYLFYATYWDSSDPWMWAKRAGAPLWTLPMMEMYLLDPFWCHAIGAMYAGGCLPSDGVVPVSSQTWPGEGVTHREVTGVAHQQMKQSPVVVDRISEALQARMRILLCSDQPVFTVRVSPDQASVVVGRDVVVNADALTLCGSAPAEYSWTVDDATIASVAPTSWGMARLKGLRVGVTTARVVAQGKTASVRLTVTSGAFTGLSIMGPDMVEARALDTWRSVPEGGIPPLSYRWKVDDIPVGSTSGELSYRNMGRSFTLSVTATDAVAATRTATFPVTVTGDGCRHARDAC